MLIGYGPLPGPGVRMVNGACLRTRQFLRGILADNHEVDLYILPIHGAETGNGKPAVEGTELDGFDYHQFTNHSGEFAVGELNDQLRRVRPDVIVSVNTYPSYVASMLSTTTPLWCDLGGSWMAEMQAKCHSEDSDDRLLSAWNIQRAILQRLDRFSTVSRPALHAVTGQLAAVGRLNKFTYNHFFGSPIPNSNYAWTDCREDENDYVLRGDVLPHMAFAMLWSGGFKPWHDVEMLMKAVNELMDRYEEVHFVATGGAPCEADDATYKKFKKLVKSSPHKDRFHLLGWVECEKLGAIYRECDLGINIDSATYETIFGGRSRVNSMASTDLGILTTVGTEVSEWLDDAHAGLMINIGDPESVIEEVEAWIDQKEKIGDYSRRALKMMNSDFTDAITTKPVCKWLESPSSAPDNQEKVRQGGKKLDYLPSISLNPLEERSVNMENMGEPNAGNDRSERLADNEEGKPLVGKLKRLFSS